MGWHPDLVRQTSVSDFNASLDGYLLSKGVQEDGMTDDEIADLQEQMAEFEREHPRGRGSLRLVAGGKNG